VNAYGEAVSSERSLKCKDREVARELTQSTGAGCQEALRAYTDHIDEHACHPSMTHRNESGASDDGVTQILKGRTHGRSGSPGIVGGGSELSNKDQEIHTYEDAMA
jgi:hypothetical protein